MEEIISIATFNDAKPARALAERLHTAGFTAEVYDESNEQKWKLFNLTPRAFMHVRVHSGEADRVLQQLAEWPDDPAVMAAIRCPECGSLRVEYPQFSRRTLMGALPAAAAAVGVIDKSYYCGGCHFTWPAEAPAPEPELDRLNWPKR